MRRSAGLYVLMVAGLVLGLGALGITWAATDQTSTLAQRLASSGSSLSVTNDGSTAVWTAAFDAAVVNEKDVQLQVKDLKTRLTYTENGQTMPVANWQDEASWRTIGIATLHDGKADFAVEHPLGVEHEYRAVINPGPSALTTQTVTYAAPRLHVEDTLPTLYLDTNDGAKIDSKVASWEGRVQVVAGTDPQCATTEPLLAKLSGRGNSTWEMEKPGLNINLDKKAGLCGLAPGKKWALIASYYDRSLLRTSVAMHLGQQLDGLAWTPHTVPVDLYVNGEYRGLYQLVERLAISTGRIDIDEIGNDDPAVDWNAAPAVTGGYLVEWDSRADGENVIELNTRGHLVIHEPANEAAGTGVTVEQLTYIKDYLLTADAALDADTFTDPDVGWRHYIDERSAVDYFIVQEYVKNIDGNFNTSVYMYKERDTAAGPGKLHLGPLWDFDESMGAPGVVVARLQPLPPESDPDDRGRNVVGSTQCRPRVPGRSGHALAGVAPGLRGTARVHRRREHADLERSSRQFRALERGRAP